MLQQASDTRYAIEKWFDAADQTLSELIHERPAPKPFPTSTLFCAKEAKALADDFAKRDEVKYTWPP